MRRLPLVLALVTTLVVAAPAAAAAPLRACKDVEGAQCGFVPVPLDRLDPASSATLRIGFELFPRTDAQRPSLGTLVFMEGGPGYSTTSSRDWYLELAGAARARRDVLLVDARGTGRSGALDCPALQSYEGDYLDNARACAAALGARATLYGSGNAAEDLVAVLDSLGIARIDLYGDSYGSFNAQTFAVRHPERVRSLVVDGTYPIAGLDPWYPDVNRAIVRAFGLVCARSHRTCGTAPGATDDAIAVLATRLASSPVGGTARDGDGVEHEVVADVDSLITLVAAADAQPVVYREVLAAARALQHGDAAPLLRLVAETTYWGDGGPVRDYSEAHYLAVACHDYPQVFDLGLDEAARAAAYDAARQALPVDLFWPFPRDAWATSSWMSYDLCLTWPAPTRDDPPLPARRGYPDVPTLVLNGDLDLRTTTELARQVAGNFPHSTYVAVANLGHVTALSDLQDCTSAIVRRFWRDLAVSNTGCAATAYAPVRMVKHVPRHLADVETTGWHGQGGLRNRRVAVLAAATVADATWRWWSMYGSDGVGLRGGTFTIDGDPEATMTLDGLRLAEDLAVSGRATWDRATGAVEARLSLDGVVAGRLRIRWPDDRPGTRATATGRVNGAPVDGSFVAP